MSFFCLHESDGIWGRFSTATYPFCPPLQTWFILIIFINDFDAIVVITVVVTTLSSTICHHNCRRLRRHCHQHHCRFRLHHPRCRLHLQWCIIALVGVNTFITRNFDTLSLLSKPLLPTQNPPTHSHLLSCVATFTLLSLLWCPLLPLHWNPHFVIAAMFFVVIIAATLTLTIIITISPLLPPCN